MCKTKIYTNILEEEAKNQFNEAMSQPENIQGALMPDAHTGYTLPIGAVIKSKETVFPSYTGFDIGCGLVAQKLEIRKEDLDLEALKSHILRKIPLGRDKHERSQRYNNDIIESMPKMVQDIMWSTGIYQLGTLGGGNHFIEIGEGRDKNIWIIVHSGSRGFGYKIAEHHMRLAASANVDLTHYIKIFESKRSDLLKHNPSKYKEVLKKHLDDVRIRLGRNNEGHHGLHIDSELGKNYLRDMNFALDFALANRKMMMDRIYDFFPKGTKKLTFINRNHNHAEVVKDNGVNHVIHRKGATHANKGMLGVIPANMRDGCFIVEGKGNDESMCSSSHGAGRKLSRRKAKETLSFEDFQSKMEGIVTNHDEGTLDESPDAYKDIFQVMDDQKDLVGIVDYVTPVLNIKG